MSISRGRTHLTGLKGRLATYALATTIAVAAVAPAAHAGTIISTAAPQPTSAYLPPCDGPVLDQPSFVGQVGNQFQVRGTGHCFTPGSSAIGEMWDSMGRRLDRAQFVINPNGALEGVNAF